MCFPSVTPKSCFHIYLLVEGFSVLISEINQGRVQDSGWKLDGIFFKPELSE